MILFSLFEAFCGLTPLEEAAFMLEINEENIRDLQDDWLEKAFFPEDSTVSGEDVSAS